MAKQGMEYLKSSDKRRLDVAGGMALSAVLAPVGAATYLAAAANIRTMNPLLRQQRVGRGGGLIDILKFRTLPRTDSEEQAQAMYGTFDPRASRVGQLMRQSGLDELPQLASVLKGDISLVGPRAMQPVMIERMAGADEILFEEWYAFYQSVRPGIMGRSQTMRHGYLASHTAGILRETMEMDLRYSDSASWQEDLRIIAETPLHLLQANIGVIDNRAEVSGHAESAV